MKLDFADSARNRTTIDEWLDGLPEGWHVCKYSDPTEPAREVTHNEARQIARTDPALICAHDGL